MLRRRKLGLASVTVSYRRTDAPVVTSRVGYGKTYAEAVADADYQLPDGVWTRLVVSNTYSIREDLENNACRRFQPGSLKRGEGQIIKVEKSVTTVLEDVAT